MEASTDLQDWEFLHSSDLQLNPKPFESLDEESVDGAIKSDYFALDSEKRHHPRTAVSEEDSEEGGVDSDNRSWVDPDSDSRYVDRSGGQMGFAGIGFPIKNSGGFWSDVSSEGQISMHDGEKGELGNAGDSIMEVGFEGVEAGCEDSGGGDSGKDLGFGEMGRDKREELGSGEVVKMGDGSDSSAEISTGSESLESSSTDEGEKREAVWWKMPLEMLKFCIFRVRPVWSISIAAAIMGVVMLGRRLYKMKYKTRSIPLKIAIDDKKASQFMARAARLNEAFSVVRRVPIIRPSLPAGSVAQWPMLSLR